MFFSRHAHEACRKRDDPGTSMKDAVGGVFKVEEWFQSRSHPPAKRKGAMNQFYDRELILVIIFRGYRERVRLQYWTGSRRYERPL